MSRTITLAVVGGVAGVLLGLAWPMRSSSKGEQRDEEAPWGGHGVEGPGLTSGARRRELQRPPIVVPRREEGPFDDPASPSYDPTKLVKLKGWSAAELFDHEPRTEHFAARREQFITTQLRRALNEWYPDAVVTEVACRTSSCRFQIEGKVADPRMFARTLQWLGWGGMYQRSYHTDEKGRTSVYAFIAFRPEEREHSSYEQQFEERWHRKQSVIDRARKADVDAGLR